jgi:hypothetical protein
MEPKMCPTVAVGSGLNERRPIALQGGVYRDILKKGPAANEDAGTIYMKYFGERLAD